MLIAELCNNHQGDMAKAKDMIKVAKESGATHVKFQAIKSDVVTGSMPKAFYEKCALKLSEYEQLFRYGKEIGMPVFFSVFHADFMSLRSLSGIVKISGAQAGSSGIPDTYNTLVSIPENLIFDAPELNNAKILYVSEYMVEDPVMTNISRLSLKYKRDVGYSDHTIGTKWSLWALNNYDVPILEKHFVLAEDQNNIKFDGQTFRDCIHAASPSQFEQLAKSYNKRGIR